MLYATEYGSRIGNLVIAGDGISILGLWIEGQKYFQDTLREKPERKDDLPIFMHAKEWLDRYFAGEKPGPEELPLAPIGGEFRQAVWECICEIPYGEVTTYGTIAKKIGALYGKKTMSAQAVGGAVGHNPISIIIPCHRVIGGDGSLTGYAGGLDKKCELLKLEGGIVYGKGKGLFYKNHNT